ncbi:MAG: hypothetical protein GTO24_21075 [candidate division Zixibacteria bacterium]|nr:hypothetical protein [candidate division Zixibacteria bacterium]
MSEKVFRELSPEEELEFRQWAHDNWSVGDEINSTWHPVVQDECRKIETDWHETFDRFLAENCAKPRFVVIMGKTLRGPQSLSDICEKIALRAAQLDAQYRVWFNELFDELMEHDESDRAKRLALSLQVIQQEINEIYQKVRDKEE